MYKKGLIVLLLLLIPAALYAEEKLLLFDVEGDAVIKSSGTTTKLGKANLLKPVKEGDRIEVGNGKVLVVSTLSKRGYEVMQDSVAEVKGSELKSIKGTVNVKTGLSARQSGPSGPIGAIVLRNTMMEPCIKTISPVNTAIITLTPVLRWSLLCTGAGKEVSVKILDGRNIIFETATDADSVAVPDGMLKYGVSYRWLIDGGPYGIIGGTFSIPEKEAIGKINEKISFYSKNDKDLAGRLSYVAYLLDNRLNDNAGVEIEKLKQDFPENEYLKEMR